MILYVCEISFFLIVILSVLQYHGISFFSVEGAIVTLCYYGIIISTRNDCYRLIEKYLKNPDVEE